MCPVRTALYVVLPAFGEDVAAEIPRQEKIVLHPATTVLVRVYTRYKNGSCEIILRFFKTFGREKSCMIEQKPFLQCV